MSLFKTAAKIIFEVQEHELTELTQYRMKNCKSCENFDEKEQQCRVCGCFMDIKTKLLTNRNPLKNRIEITHCPEGKWMDAHIANMYREMDGKQRIQ